MSKKFKRLLVPEGYRHYWSKYPEGYTILEALLNWVDSVNQLTENVNDWNIYLDDFVENFDEKLRPTVREMLNEMEQDGRLADIINEEILSWKADKTYVDDEFNTIHTQINHIQYLLTDYEAHRVGEDWAPAFYHIFDIMVDGSVIKIPDGVFKVSRVDIHKSIKIIGPGTLESIDNNVILQIDEAEGVYIENITFDHKNYITPYTAATAGRDSSITVWGASRNITINQCTFNNTGRDGVYIRAHVGSEHEYAHNVLVQNSQFNNITRNCVSVISGDNIHVLNNTMSNWGLTGVDFEPNVFNLTNCSVINNKIYSSPTSNGASFQYSTETPNKELHHSLYISNNLFTGSRDKQTSVLRLYGVYYANVINNTIDTYNHFAISFDANHSTLEDNQLINPQVTQNDRLWGAAITVQGSYNYVSRNTIPGASNHGMYVSGDNNHIIDNEIYNVGLLNNFDGVGILLYTNDSIIEGNLVMDTQTIPTTYRGIADRSISIVTTGKIIRGNTVINTTDRDYQFINRLSQHVIDYGNKKITNNSLPKDGDGVWSVGDQIISRFPTAGDFIGWVCVESGEPGEWKGFGLIESDN